MLMYIFLLLVVYQLKHFLCDYPLQNGFMLGKFKPGWGFLEPLLAHSAVHAAFTFLIAFFLGRSIELVLLVTAIDFVVHFTMDRIKAGPKYLGRFKALTPYEFKECSKAVGTPDQWNPRYVEQCSNKLRGNTFFWWALGFDQMVHHLTHYLIIFLLVTHG